MILIQTSRITKFFFPVTPNYRHIQSTQGTKLSLGSLNSTPGGTLAPNFPGGDLQTQVGVDMDHELNLAVGLDALDSKLSNRLLGLPDDLAGLLFFVIIREVGVVILLSLGGLLLLGLGFGLGDLDLADTFADAHEDISTLLRGVVLSDTAGGKGGLGVQERGELKVVTRGELNTDGVAEVRGDGDRGVDGLLNVFRLELGDQRGLDGGTSGGQLGGVDGGGGCRRSKDTSLLGESVADKLGDLGGVRGTTGKDNLVNVQNIQVSLLDSLLNQGGELAEHLAGQKLVTRPVNGRAEVNTIRQALNAQGSVGTETESTLCSLTLQLQLGQTTGVLAGVTLVLLNEFLGEVIDDNLVQSGTTQFVVVSGSKGRVHASTASKNRDVGPGTTKVSNDDQLVGHNGFGSSIVGQGGSDGLVNELENLEASTLGGSDQGLTLSICEVARDCDNGSVDFLTEVVRGRLLQTKKVASSNLGNSEGVRGLAGGVADGESDSRVILLGVGGLLAGCGVYRLEVLAEVVSEICNGVLRVANELCLGLSTVEFLSIDVRENSRDLTVYNAVSMVLFPVCSTRTGDNEPPSSLAITSALPSCNNSPLVTVSNNQYIITQIATNLHIPE